MSGLFDIRKVLFEFANGIDVDSSYICLFYRPTSVRAIGLSVR